MNSDKHADRIHRIDPEGATGRSHPKGNILVYLVVVILIFGVLGVSLVSLFTTATGSSATPNDAKRTRFIAESGIRYALSEIRNSPDLETAAELLNTTSEFKLGKDGSFTADVFSPGLKSAQTTTFPIFGGSLTMNVPYSGEFPDDFAVHNAANNFYIVDWRKFPGPNSPLPDDPTSAFITGSTDARGAPNITVNLNDNYDITIGDTVCFALLTTDSGTIRPGDSIYVNEGAVEFFPTDNGAIRIVNEPPTGDTYDYFYEKRVHDTTNSRVELTNIREMPGDSWQGDITLNERKIMLLF